MAKDTSIKNEKKQKSRNKYLEGQYIEGSLDVLPNPKYKAKDVYCCRGLGALFNGNYYVRSVTHTIDSSGYTVSLDVQNVDHVFVPKDVKGKKPVSVAPSSSKTYKIQSGDTLSGIAQRFGTTWNKLFEMNRDVISDPNKIYPNQVIKVP